MSPTNTWINSEDLLCYLGLGFVCYAKFGREIDKHAPPEKLTAVNSKTEHMHPTAAVPELPVVDVPSS